MNRHVPSCTVLAVVLCIATAGSTAFAQSADDGLGGIYNVGLFVIDEARFRTAFGGDTITLEFLPVDLVPMPDRTVTYFEMFYYSSEVVVRSRRRGAELMRFFVDYRVNGEHVFSDRTRSPGADDVRYAGSYRASMDDPISETVGIYEGMFGVRFDFAFQQGDTLRFGPRDGTAADVFARNFVSDINLVPAQQYLGSGSLDSPAEEVRSMPSYGRPHLQVEMKECSGCTETLVFQKQGRTYTFPDVPYMTIAVRNDASLVRVDDATGQGDTVRYDFDYALDEWAEVTGDTARGTATVARLTDPDRYALYAFGWLDLDELGIGRPSPIQRARFAATSPLRPIGTAGRYYMGRVTGTDDQGTAHTLSFTHSLFVNGAEIYLDFAGMGSPGATYRTDWLPDSMPRIELAAGDRFGVEFSGGTLGLPEPGATVDLAINQSGGVSITKTTTGAIVRVHPNPLRERATFDLHVAEPGPVRLQIVTADGRTVAMLIDEPLATGDYRIEWEPVGLATGMYYYTAVTPSGTENGVVQVR
jgi:hypothetical protein